MPRGRRWFGIGSIAGAVALALVLSSANTALDRCIRQGYRVTVTVVGRDDQAAVVLKGDGAGPRTVESSRPETTHHGVPKGR